MSGILSAQVRAMFLLMTLAASTAACARQDEAAIAPRPMSWEEVQDLPLPKAGQRIAYGPAPQQFGELRVPAGAGPFPIVVLIHGGCWLDALDYRYMTHLAARLTDGLGVATWTVEYRRVGNGVGAADGGWPNTFLDVASAVDHLRELAPAHALDLKRVVTLGHSAGGQLALWLAARKSLKTDSQLYRERPLPIRGVVGLAAIADLAAYGEQPGGCNGVVHRLMGGTPQKWPLRYAQASPRALLPLHVPQWLIQGADDPIVSLGSVRLYALAAKAAGDSVVVEADRTAGHFEPVIPQTAAGAVAITAVTEAVRMSIQ